MSETTEDQSNWWKYAGVIVVGWILYSYFMQSPTPPTIQPVCMKEISDEVYEFDTSKPVLGATLLKK